MQVTDQRARQRHTRYVRLQVEDVTRFETEETHLILGKTLASVEAIQARVQEGYVTRSN
jgi:hypothetical protein